MADQPFTVRPSAIEMVEDLAAIQRACFPTISADELFLAEHYAAHIKRFPEGQLMVVETASGRPVACSTDLRRHMDMVHIQHRFSEAIGGMFLTAHEPDGDWLYGADIGVHPDYRGHRLSSLLYQARHQLVRDLGLRGHVAGGYLAGYGAVKDQMSVEDYVAKVQSGEIWDATSSIQLKRGYRVHGILQHYVDDPLCDNKACFIIWDNPDLQDSRSS
ncbi:MAG: GNAT family N-acetyltransferase [Alphaproteobacteria bacterium]